MRTPRQPPRPAARPVASLSRRLGLDGVRSGFGLFARVLIVLFLLVGLILCYKLSMRMYYRHMARNGGPVVVASPPPTTSGSPGTDPGPGPDPAASASPGPDARPTVAAIRDAPDSDPGAMFRAAFRIIAGSSDILEVDLALVELEGRLEGYYDHREKIFAAVDHYKKDASNRHEELAAMFLDSLVSLQIFFHERYNTARAEEALQKIVADEDPVLSPLALHRQAQLRLAEDSRQAIRLFKQQIETWPDCPLNGQAAFFIGACYRVLEEDYNALEQFQFTLKTYPKAVGQGGVALEPYVRHAMAEVYIRIDRKEDAREQLAHIKEYWESYRHQAVIEELLRSVS